MKEKKEQKFIKSTANNIFKESYNRLFKMKKWQIFEILLLVIIIGVIIYKVDLKETFVLILSLSSSILTLLIIINFIVLVLLSLSLKYLFDTVKKISFK